MKDQRGSGRHRRLSIGELAREAAEFDRELVADSFSAPGPRATRQWAAAKKARRTTVLSISIDRDLLARVDLLARKKGLTRDGLIALGLRAILVVDGPA